MFKIVKYIPGRGWSTAGTLSVINSFTLNDHVTSIPANVIWINILPVVADA